MKKALIFIVLFSSVYFRFIYVDGQEIKSRFADLAKIMTILQRENINIEEWTIYAREKFDDVKNTADVEKLYDALVKKYADWEWSTTDEKDKWSAVAYNQHPNGIKESIQILSTRTNNPQTYITYQISSNRMIPLGEVEGLERSLIQLSDIFRENATFFTCIRGKLNDKMNTAVQNYVNELLDGFQAKEVESVMEENFVALSANSPYFGEGLRIGNQQMNLQIGMKTERLGAETTIVVGTPIITVEY